MRRHHRRRLHRRGGFTYGLLGLPLAFIGAAAVCAQPLRQGFGVPLATLGAILLLGARLFDAKSTRCWAA
jgi:hypothetical protein